MGYINEDGLVSSYLCDLVKLAEQFIQHMHKFTWRAVTGQPGEAHNVGIQNAAENKTQNNTITTAYLVFSFTV